MNEAHGRITFWGLEIPTKLIRNIKLTFRDRCDHTHVDNKKKRKYKFCEECGKQRFFINQTPTELSEKLEDRLIYSLIEDRRTALPSPCLEYRVIPEPFVCRCQLLTAPKFIALPSPNCETK